VGSVLGTGAVNEEGGGKKRGQKEWGGENRKELCGVGEEGDRDRKGERGRAKERVGGGERKRGGGEGEERRT